MNTRDELTLKAIDIARNVKNLAILLPTGTGKTLISIKIANEFKGKWLVVIAERAHKKNWIDDIHKHGFDRLLQSITFVCYASLKKYKSANPCLLISSIQFFL